MNVYATVADWPPDTPLEAVIGDFSANLSAPTFFVMIS